MKYSLAITSFGQGILGAQVPRVWFKRWRKQVCVGLSPCLCGSPDLGVGKIVKVGTEEDLQLGLEPGFHLSGQRVWLTCFKHFHNFRYTSF